MVSTFYLGRFSIQPPKFPSFSFSGATSVGETKAAPATEKVEANTGVKKAETTPTAAVTAQDAETGEESAAGNETTASTTDDGPVITSYSKVALALESVKTQWKETYGKITDVSYTLKNNEAGIIKPAYFHLLVKGYDDFEKKIPLPLSQQKVAAGETKSLTIKVPYGFAYNKATIPDLPSATVTLVLYDANGKQMASVTQNTNLPWESG